MVLVGLSCFVFFLLTGDLHFSQDNSHLDSAFLTAKTWWPNAGHWVGVMAKCGAATQGHCQSSENFGSVLGWRPSDQEG